MPNTNKPRPMPPSRVGGAPLPRREQAPSRVGGAPLPERGQNAPPYRMPIMENMPIIRDDMKGNGFTPYAAGKKHYGTGRGAPNVGATGNMAGYAMRDGKAAARRQALMRRTGGM